MEISEKYEKLKNQWKNSFNNPAAVISASDPLSDETRRNFFFSVLDKEVNRMNGMLRKPNRAPPPERPMSTSSKLKNYYRRLAQEVDLERTYDPPGIASFTLCHTIIGIKNFVIH